MSYRTLLNSAHGHKTILTRKRDGQGDVVMKTERAGHMKTAIAGRMKSALSKTLQAAQAAKTGRKHPGKLMSLAQGETDLEKTVLDAVQSPHDPLLTRRFKRPEGLIRLRRRGKTDKTQNTLLSTKTETPTDSPESASLSKAQWEKDVALVLMSLDKLTAASFRASSIGQKTTVRVPDPYTASVFRAVLEQSRQSRKTDRLITVEVSKD